MEDPTGLPALDHSNGGASGSPVASVEVVYPLAQVYEASNGILDHLEEESMEVSLGCFALALTLGRVLSPSELTPQDEQAFVKDLLEYIGARFAEGVAN